MATSVIETAAKVYTASGYGLTGRFVVIKGVVIFTISGTASSTITGWSNVFSFPSASLNPPASIYLWGNDNSKKLYVSSDGYCSTGEGSISSGSAVSGFAVYPIS